VISSNTQEITHRITKIQSAGSYDSLYVDGMLDYRGNCQDIPIIENIRSLNISIDNGSDRICRKLSEFKSLTDLRIFYIAQTMAISLDRLERSLERLTIDNQLVRQITSSLVELTPPSEPFINLRILELGKQGRLNKPLLIGGDPNKEIEISGID
jgi:hypothetical protein